MSDAQRRVEIFKLDEDDKWYWRFLVDGRETCRSTYGCDDPAACNRALNMLGGLIQCAERLTLY